MGRKQRRGQRKESRGRDWLQKHPPPLAGRLRAYLIRWREIAKLELATYTERPRARLWAWDRLRKLRNCGGKRIWQPDFLWLYPRLISLQCSVCAWMEMIPVLRGTGVRKSKTHASRKKGEGIGGRGRWERNLSFRLHFLFSGEDSHHSVSWPVNHHHGPVYHISHLLKNSLNIKRQSISSVRGLTREEFACF